MITLGIYAAKTKLSEICERVASGSSWSSLSHRWVLEAASRLACREKLLRRQARTVRRTRPSHHRRDTHRRAVPGNCRQSIARRSTIQRFSRIACPRSLLGLPNGSSYRLLLIRFCVSTLCTGESNRPRYVWMYKVPMAATPSPVDESSGSKLSDQLREWSRMRGTTPHWVSIAALPPGHTSPPGALGRRGAKVAPGRLPCPSGILVVPDELSTV